MNQPQLGENLVEVGCMTRHKGRFREGGAGAGPGANTSNRHATSRLDKSRTDSEEDRKLEGGESYW